MSEGVLETTRRDLAELKGWSFVPLTWSSVTEADIVLGANDAMTWQVAGPPDKQAEVVTVRLRHGSREWVGDMPRDGAVHVLNDCSGTRRSEYLGVDAVRRKKGQS